MRVSDESRSIAKLKTRRIIKKDVNILSAKFFFSMDLSNSI